MEFSNVRSFYCLKINEIFDMIRAFQLINLLLHGYVKQYLLFPRRTLEFWRIFELNSQPSNWFRCKKFFSMLLRQSGGVLILTKLYNTNVHVSIAQKTHRKSISRKSIKLMIQSLLLCILKWIFWISGN